MEILKWCREYKTLENVFTSLCLIFSVGDAPSYALISLFPPRFAQFKCDFSESHNKETVFPTAHSLTRTYCLLDVRNES